LLPTGYDLSKIEAKDETVTSKTAILTKPSGVRWTKGEKIVIAI
jgi:hypothetical protein